jgi:DNA-binding MarR family transcriptional regulator
MNILDIVKYILNLGDMDKALDRIRSFNRFYTSQLGVLNKHILESKFSISEARVLYELNNIEQCTARKIMASMEIDEGYLSRIIERFIATGLAVKEQSSTDRRAKILKPTVKGVAEFRKINLASSRSIRNMIRKVSEKDLQMMLLMMESIQNILTNAHEADTQ